LKKIVSVRLSFNWTISTYCEPSATHAANNKCKESNVLNFTVGENKFPPPKQITLSLMKIAQSISNYRDYPDNQGLPELRKAVAHYIQHLTGKIEPIENHMKRIVIRDGVKSLLSDFLHFLSSLKKPLFHFLLPKPSWVTYEEQLKLNNFSYQTIQMGFNTTTGTYLSNLEKVCLQLENVPKNQNNILILNRPSNPPLGVQMNDKFCESLSKICSKYNLWVIADEIYREVSFPGISFTPFSKFYPQTFSFGGTGKVFSSPGYSIGYLEFPHHNYGVNSFVNRITQTRSATNIMSQLIAQDLYTELYDPKDNETKRHIELTMNAFKEMYLFVKNRFTENGIDVVGADSGYYILAKIPTNDSSEVFCETLSKTKHIALIPGTKFGIPEEKGYATFRLTLRDFEGDRLLDYMTSATTPSHEEFPMKEFAPKIVTAVESIIEHRVGLLN